MVGKRGYVVLLALVFLSIFFVLVTSAMNYVLQYEKYENFTLASVQALNIAEAGTDQALSQLNLNPSYTGETNTVLNGGTFTTVVTNDPSGSKVITSTGYVPDSTNPAATRIVKITAGVNPTVVSFRYGIQSGNGGFVLNGNSNSWVDGNVFSGGPVVATGQGDLIKGDVISAGATGLINSIHATGTAFAHTIQNSTIEKDAHYQTITSTTVSGSNCPNAHCFPNSTDQNTVALPISDAQISQWESDAAVNVATCTNGSYTISSNVTLGPLKIPCDLNINGTGGGVIVTIAGPVWVQGNISTSQTSIIKMAASLGSQNVAIIADNPTASTTSGTISITQNVSFQGSGSVGSFVFMISQNGDAENGGTHNVDALTMNNGSSALVAYASHGRITLSQSTGVKEVTAYKIVLANSAQVTYDSGLPSTIFESGTGGSWTFTPGSYRVVQ